jgi:hypothetical protein
LEMALEMGLVKKGSQRNRRKWEVQKKRRRRVPVATGVLFRCFEEKGWEKAREAEVDAEEKGKGGIQQSTRYRNRQRRRDKQTDEVCCPFVMRGMEESGGQRGKETTGNVYEGGSHVTLNIR